MEDASHRRLGNPEPGEASEYVADPSRAPLGVRGTRLDDLCTRNCQTMSLRLVRLRSRALVTLTRPQRFHPPAVEQPHELLDDRGRHPERDRCVRVRRSAHHRLHDAYSDRVRDLPLSLQRGR